MIFFGQLLFLRSRKNFNFKANMCKRSLKCSENGNLNIYNSTTTGKTYSVEEDHVVQTKMDFDARLFCPLLFHRAAFHLDFLLAKHLSHTSFFLWLIFLCLATSFSGCSTPLPVSVALFLSLMPVLTSGQFSLRCHKNKG